MANYSTEACQTRYFRVFVALLIAWISITSVTRAEAEASPWSINFAKGETALTNGSLKEAEQDFLLSERQYDSPEHRTEATYAIALVKYQGKDFKECEKKLKEVVKLESSYGDLNKSGSSSYVDELLGDIRSNQGHLDDAKVRYEQALQANKNQKGFSARQQERLLKKIADLSSNPKAIGSRVSDYLVEYGLAFQVAANLHVTGCALAPHKIKSK